MDLQTFDHELDPIILQRGFDYYKQNKIISVQADRPNQFELHVQGSQIYTVTVTLDQRGRILATACDCPYDFGEYCKHQAAAFYLLRERKAQRKKRKPPFDLATALHAVPKDALIALILEFAHNDSAIHQRLRGLFAPDEELLNQSRLLIRRAIRDAAGRDGFIQWNRTSEALQGADEVLQQARERVKQGSGVTAARLCFIVLPEVIGMLDHCDDSDGDCGWTVTETLDVLKQATVTAASHESPTTQAKLYRRIMKAEAAYREQDWGAEWRNQLLEAAVELCANESLRRRWTKVVDGLVAVQEKSQYGLRQQEKLLFLKYKLTEKWNGKAAAHRFLYDHLHFPMFRSEALYLAATDNHWEAVYRLCLPDENALLPTDWQQNDERETLHLQACLQLNKIAEARKLTLSFLCDRDDYDYFAKLHALYPADEWPAVVEKVIDRFEKKGSASQAYVKILVHERQLDRLLHYCRRFPSEISELYPQLIDRFPAAVAEIFTAYIREQARNAGERKAYHNVCRLIRTFRKACGNAATDRLIDDLLVKNRRRPAFVDELHHVRNDS